MAGSLEYETRREVIGDIEDDLVIESVVEVETTLEPVPSTSTAVPMSTRNRSDKSKRTPIVYKPLSAFPAPNWTKRLAKDRHFEYDLNPVSDPLIAFQQALYDRLKDKSPSELFRMFFDDTVLEFIINHTNKYAQQKNSTFSISKPLLKRFLGILVFSGFHPLPAVHHYWSTSPVCGIPIVKQAMPRNTFNEIKSFLHFNDNDNIDKTDKLAKVNTTKLLITNLLVI